MTTITEELMRLYQRIGDEHDVSIEFERLGVSDHDGLRTFGAAYGEAIGQMIEQGEHRQIGHDDLGATMVGGILIGLLYAESMRKQVTV